MTNKTKKIRTVSRKFVTGNAIQRVYAMAPRKPAWIMMTDCGSVNCKHKYFNSKVSTKNKIDKSKYMIKILPFYQVFDTHSRIAIAEELQLGAQRDIGKTLKLPTIFEIFENKLSSILAKLMD